MKKHIKPSKFLQQAIVVFGLFMMLPAVSLAQQNTREQIESRIRSIDINLKKLTYEKEAIGLEFEAISNFSIQARPILVGYNQIVEAIKLKENEKQSLYFLWEQQERRTWEGEYQSLIAQRDNYRAQFRNSGGITSCFRVQCNTIGELQNEYARTVEYYQEKKKEYDNIALELGNLNNEKHELTADLNSIGGIQELYHNIKGCWNLRTGKYISTITVSTEDEIEYVGYLTVNNLNNYRDGQLMFRVTRESYDTFRGMEITYREINGYEEEVRIPMKITINSDDNFLTWTSDETVTMQRCVFK